LAVVKANGFNVFETIKRPSQAGGGVLTARKKNQGGPVEI